MAKHSLLARLRDFLTSRRFTWAATILFGVVVVLYFLFVTFLFNPFEKPLGDTASIVPRQVSYFLRWKGAGQRFDRFPVLNAWKGFAETAAYRELEQGGELEKWGEELGIRKIVADLEQATSGLPPGVSLERDLLREVVVAGNGRPALDAQFDGVLMMRVSFKVKAGVSLLGFGFVRDKLPDSLGIENLRSGRYRLPQFAPFGFQDAYLTRVRDVVLIASREEWLDQARSLDLASGEGSLAQASVFHDNVEAHLAPGDLPVDVFLRWDTLASHFGRWPDPQPGEFVNQLLGRFFTSDFMRVVAGYWLPGERFEGRFSGDVDLSAATPFQRGWAEAEGVSVHWIRQFAGLVPPESFLFLAVSGNPGRVLEQLFSSLEEDVQRILDESVVSTGKYQGMTHLLDEIGGTISGNMFLALRRDDYPPDPKRDVEHDDRPVPLFVLMASLRDKPLFDQVLAFFMNNAQHFSEGAEQTKVQTVSLAGGASAIAFASPAIPGTGEFVVLELPARRAVVISNSFKYAEDVVSISFLNDRDPATAKRKLSEKAGFAAALGELQRGPKLFCFADPSEARHWLDELTEEQARERFLQEMDPLYREWRPGETERLRKELFGEVAGELSEEEEYQLGEAVEQALFARSDQRWQERRPLLLGEIRRALLPWQLCDWLSASFEADRRHASVVISGALDLD